MTTLGARIKKRREQLLLFSAKFVKSAKSSCRWHQKKKKNRVRVNYLFLPTETRNIAETYPKDFPNLGEEKGRGTAIGSRRDNHEGSNITK
jgi:hypothetical protein